MRVVVFFFFKQKTAYEWRISYWSSDVCSSDLAGRCRRRTAPRRARRGAREAGRAAGAVTHAIQAALDTDGMRYRPATAALHEASPRRQVPSPIRFHHQAINDRAEERRP